MDTISPADSGNIRQRSRRIVGEFVLNYDMNESVKLLLGYRYQRMFDISNYAYAPEIGFYSKQESDAVNSHDFFWQMDWELTDKLELELGGRWTRTNSYTLHQQGAFANATGKLHYDSSLNFTPRIALIYNVNSNYSINAVYSEALRDNDINEIDSPEKIATYELNHTYRTDNMHLQLSAFRNELSQVARISQFLNPNTNQLEIITDDSAEITTHGLEALASYKYDKFLFELSGTWQRSKDKASNNSILAHSPEFLAKAKVYYTHKNWRVGLFVNHVSGMKSDFIYDSLNSSVIRTGDSVSAYTTVGANLRYQPGDWYINIHADNLFDHEVRYAANELVDLQKGSFGPGRTFLISFGYEF